ncbi:hypothetical protein [Kitasatospora sp. NPDC093558]|uniref:hypothetical protein n=1 Tax=Kitasatospora sp. NPDC093558 TaxID=3155201 RepID=UPI003446BB82
MEVEGAAAAVVLAIAAGVTGVPLYNLTIVGGPDTVRDGAATADEVHDTLGAGRISEQRVGDSSATAVDPVGGCGATVTFGLFGKSRKSVWFKVRRDAKSAVDLASPEARLFSGDSVGSVTPGTAWALLPDGCQKGLRAEVQGSDGSDEGRARLAVAYANHAAKALNCKGKELPAPKGLSARGVPATPDWTALCGLPGLAPARDPQARDGAYKQRVTTASAPIWSCAIGTRSSQSSDVQFTITTEPRVTTPSHESGRSPSPYGRALWTGEPGSQEVVATCRGKDVFFHLDSGYEPVIDSQRLVPDGNDLWRQFLTAGGKAVGCEPIL